MTNFEKVQMMNRMFGKFPVRDLSSDVIECQWGLIIEECTEVFEAMEGGYTPDLRKELCDLLVVTYGMLDLIGASADEDFDVVNESNMSKACMTRAEVNATAKMYHDMGLDVRIERHDGEHTIFYSLRAQEVNGKFYPEGKVLKPAHYRAAELD